jgi:4-hydroxybenzoate polyprenyltransferase
MGRALLIVGWIATLVFVASGLERYVRPQESSLQGHMLLALVASLLLLFAHCWIMFYLIGTGKALKDAVLAHGLEGEIVEATKRYKNRSYPWIMLAMGLAMAAFILGGGTFTGSVPLWLHVSLAAATLLAQVWTLLVEGQVLVANDRLMKDVDRRISGR